MNRLLQRVARGDQGAIAVTFMISFFALLGFALLAIDGGSLYLSQRGQVADTDAAALAVAQSLIEDRCFLKDGDFLTEAQHYVDLNDPATTVVDVDVARSGNCATGEVTVHTRRDATLFFGPIFGFDRAPTEVISRAKFGPQDVYINLRPFGFCAAEPHYELEWRPEFLAKYYGGTATPAPDAVVEALYDEKYPELGSLLRPNDWHPTARGVDQSGESYRLDSDVHRFPRGADGESWCPGGRSGNFGYFDFDPEPNETVASDCSGVPGNDDQGKEIRCDLLNGYQGPVVIDPPDCQPTTADTGCGGQTGRLADLKSVFELLRCPASLAADDPSCAVIYIVVFQSTDDPNDPGNNALYDLSSVVGVVLRDFKTEGKQTEMYLDLEFVDELADGQVGDYDRNSTSTANLGVNLCGTGSFNNC